MAIDTPLHLQVLIGHDPMHAWEHKAIETVRAMAGMRVTVSSETAENATEKEVRYGGSLFRSYVQRATGASALDERDKPRMLAAAAGGDAPDAILLLSGASAPRGAAPRHGTWSFITEEGTSAHALPPGIAAAILQRPVVHFHLVDTARDVLLRTGCFPVDASDPYATADRVLAHAAIWPAQVLTELRGTGSVQAAETPPKAMPVEVPGPFTMLMRRIKQLLMGDDNALDAVDGAFGDWNIGILHQPIHTLLQEDASINVRWFPSPGSGRGRVEPFAYRATDDEMNVLYRKTDNGTGSGVIARLRPKPDNILKRSRTMLHSRTDHAYPYTLVVDGTTHVLGTEPAENRTVIMRINDQNDALENATVLLPVVLHAPTLFQHEGRWWLMGTQDPLVDAALYIFHGTSPFGPFEPHAQNPVKCDVRSSRPAGTPFIHNGSLWRPALDASDPGAFAVVINKVNVLSPELFHEEPKQRLEGFPSTAYGRGVRTVCAMGDVTLVDGARSPVLDGGKANGSRGKSQRRRHKQKSVE